MSIAVKMTMGTFYLIGATLLLPGFVWIQPLESLCFSMLVPGPPAPIPTLCSNPNIVSTVARIPHFKDGSFGSSNDYGTGVWCIVFGTLLFIIASLIDFVSALSTPHHTNNHEEGQSNAGDAGSCLKRMLGPTLMVCGSCLIFAGSIMFLPRFSMGGKSGEPLDIFGRPFPDVASFLFQVAAVVFFVSALIAIFGVATGIAACRKRGQPTCTLWFSLLAFVCFLPCSTLYFGNSFVKDDVQAGHWRMGGTIFLATACYLLFAVTVYEVCQGHPLAPNNDSAQPLDTL